MRRGASGAGLAEPRLKNILDHEEGGAGPEGELESGQDGVGAGSSAHGATAEEKLAEEDGEGNEAGEVEEDVEKLKGNGTPGVGG